MYLRMKMSEETVAKLDRAIIPNNGGDQPRNTRILKFQFRWDIHRVDHNTIELHIPTGGTQPIVNPRWAEMMGMSDSQLEAAELFILRQVAILPQ